MQKLTVTFIYGNDEERRLRYRVTDDMPVGVMLEKLIGFQFVIDSADPTTFHIVHKGAELSDLTKTFEECSVSDGDEIYLMPTVFEPVPPLRENDIPVKKQNRDKPHPRRRISDLDDIPKKEPFRKPGSASYSQRRRRPEHGSYSAPTKASAESEREKAPQVQTSVKSDGAPVPFKPKSRSYHRNHSKKPSAPKSNS